MKRKAWNMCINSYKKDMTIFICLTGVFRHLDSKFKTGFKASRCLSLKRKRRRKFSRKKEPNDAYKLMYLINININSVIPNKYLDIFPSTWLIMAPISIFG